MSVIVTANFEGETFEVEIFHDGSLDFPGRDLEHDQVLVALGGKPSIIVRFDDSWTKNRIEAIFKNTELPENTVTLLAADYAEHVLPIYEHKYPGDLRPRQVVGAVRKFVSGKIKITTLERYEDAAARAARASWAAEAAARASWAAARASWAARAVGEAARAALAAALAAAEATRASAYNVSSDSDSLEWQQAYNIEVAWQVRRFVDCMEDIGQGKNWPDMKETP